MTSTTVLIAEDEPLAAEALADWVRATPGLQLVAVCEDGEDALAQIRALRPALVLTDIQMPGLTGLQVVQALQGDAHSPRIIFTTGVTGVGGVGVVWAAASAHDSSSAGSGKRRSVTATAPAASWTPRGWR